jgi:hypothetical protein
VGRQEQAFRAYYGSMTDAELLEVAANKTSFIGIAQKILADELDQRHLTAPLATRQSAPERTALSLVSDLAKRLGGVFRR